MNTKHAKSGIAGGMFLIGLGVLAITGTWWPGIMVVIGLAVGAERAFRGYYVQALTVFAVCVAIALISATNIPWHIFAPFILISLGAGVLVQGVLTKQS